MEPWLRGGLVGNPSGGHVAARRAHHAVESAREQIAEIMGANVREIVFTSGGTESDNLAVLGTYQQLPKMVLCAATEHPAVLRAVEEVGGKTIPVENNGQVDLAAFASQCESEKPGLVSLMLVNNETGVMQPLHRARRVLQRVAPDALLHTDAAQAVRVCDVARLTKLCDLVTLSSHKFGGPQGVGALVVRVPGAVSARAKGGPQEGELRAGSLNVVGIAGMAAAMCEAVLLREAFCKRMEGFRERFLARIREDIQDVFVAGDELQTPTERASHITQMCFLGIESESLLLMLDQRGICASAGSSCSSGALEPSHVLTAMGVSPELAKGSLRISFGETTTEAEVDQAARAIVHVVMQLRDNGAGVQRLSMETLK